MYPCTEDIIQPVEGHLLKCGSGLLGEKEKCKREREAGGSSCVRETRLLPRLWLGCARTILHTISRRSVNHEIRQTWMSRMNMMLLYSSKFWNCFVIFFSLFFFPRGNFGFEEFHLQKCLT